MEFLKLEMHPSDHKYPNQLSEKLGVGKDARV